MQQQLTDAAGQLRKQPLKNRALAPEVRPVCLAVVGLEHRKLAAKSSWFPDSRQASCRDE